MIERRMTVSQARHLLRALTERKQAHFVLLGEDILSPGGDAKMAPKDSQLTYRALEYFRQQSNQADPRIRLKLFENIVEMEGYEASEDEEATSSLTEQSLERRAREAASDVASKAKDVASAAKNVQAIASGFKIPPKDRKRTDVQETLKEMERAFRKFRSSTHAAIEEYLGNENPLVMDLIKDYDLDVEGARHGLRVACLATELAAHLRPETYFGKAIPDDMYERLGTPQEERDYSPDGIDQVRQQLFRRELVEIFLGGFLHDAGLWSSPVYHGHAQRGALIVSEISLLGENADAIVDMVLLHGELGRLATNGAVIRTSPDDEEDAEFEYQFYPTPETAEEDYLLGSGGGGRLIQEEGLRTILPVAIAEFYVTASEDEARRTPRDIIAEAVDVGDTALYAKFMMSLCNSQPKVEAPPRALVGFEGKLPAGARGKKHLMELDGDIGVSVYNTGWQGPYVIRILRKRPDGGLEKLERLQPGHPALRERSHQRGYMYIPVGRMGNLTATVIGILGKEVFERNFRAYADWAEQIADDAR
jgi:hypothetical protein